MVLKKRKHSTTRLEDVPLADYGADENITDSAKIQWVNQPWVRGVLRGMAILSFISVSCNTPQTFKLIAHMRYITFVIDIMVSVIFTAEMLAKMHMRGIVRGEAPYLKDNWCVFDAFMVVFVWVSVVLQFFQLTDVVAGSTSLSILRSPRPLIAVRCVRVYLKFQLPKSRVMSIFKRSGQQVWSVTIFLVFFLVLYGMLGVQMFGSLSSHCVLNNTHDEPSVIDRLAIPDTYCSMEDNMGHKCHRGMVCQKLELGAESRQVTGYNGFEHIGSSIFTVYESASLEGWVFVMYKVTDSFPPWRGYFFFITMIFFLAWLVKNVFIAVIIETFAEIRVQFRQMWTSRNAAESAVDSKVLQDDGTCTPWKLTTVDENKPRGLAPHCCQVILQSRAFHLVILMFVIADALLASTYNMLKNFGKDKSDQYHDFLYVAQVSFTVLFDLEVMFKIWCLGFRGYIKRSLHKFEMCLAVGTTLHLFDPLYHTQVTYFQVMRCVRLIKLSPTLEDFSRKIFGPFVKLGTLILFTMSSLIIVSVISLQLFCSIDNLDTFQTFPSAFMAMFQILTQEGWIEVMNDCLLHAGEQLQVIVAVFFIMYHLFSFVAFISMFQILTQKGWAVVMYECMLATDAALASIIAIYFITYHLFATVIVLSMFVAVILDNLELDEDLKSLKHLQATEQRNIIEKLPLRLRVFEKFPDKPQMVCLSRLPSEFSLPKIRDSFIRQFVETGTDMERLLRRSVSRDTQGPGHTQAALFSLPDPANQLRLLRRRAQVLVTSHIPGLVHKKTGISSIVRNSAHQRVLSLGYGAVGYRGRMLSEYGSRDRRSVYRLRALRGSLRGHKPMESIKENGDTITNRNVSFNIKVIQERKQQAVQKRTAKEEELRENHPYFDTPLFAVGRESRVRKICNAIVYARYNATLTDESGMAIKRRYQGFYDFLAMVTYLTWFSIVFTVAACISMMFEDASCSVMVKTPLQVSEYVFVIFMSLEIVLKVLADGLFFTPKALIRDIGGVLDVFIYFVSLVFICWLPRNIPPNSLAHIFMILRCFRPLRIFTLVPHLRKMVYEVLRGIKEMMLVSILLFALMFIFASYGVQIFATKLAKCNDASITSKDLCVGHFIQNVSVVKFRTSPKNESQPGFMVPRVWANPRNFDFDNLANALLALFEVLSLEGWLEVRDIVLKEVHWSHGVYIHIFVFIGCMIGLTLFVGVVITNYFESKGTSLLTIDQRRWQDLKGRLSLAQPLHLPPRPDHSIFRARMYDVTQHKFFKRFIACLVLINFFLLSYRWVESDNKDAAQALANVSVLLTNMFVLEVILKCISLSPIGYWHSRRNRYDLFVTVMGVVWVAVYLSNQQDQFKYSLGSAVILFRFFTITGKHPTLKMLMMTIVVSMVKSFFIIVGLFILITFYAFTGVVLFGKVKYGEMLNRHANFERVPNAIAVLFRIVTGEDWNKIMHDCMISPPYCSRVGDNYWETDCGNVTASLLYFGSFYVIIAYIFLNLLVGIIMENFSLFYSNEEDALLSYADIKNFQITWNTVDVGRKGVIPVSRVKFVLRLLRGRLEVDMDKDRLLYKHMCCEIEKMRNGQDVTFHDVLSMLSYRSVDIRKSLQLDELLAREELEYNIEEEVAKETIRTWLEKVLKRMRAKEKAHIHIPNFLMGSLNNERESHKILDVPAFIETAAKDDAKPEDHEGNEKLKPSPDANREQDHVPQSSPSHKLLVPTLSEGGTKPDIDDQGAGLRIRRPGRRLQPGSSPTTPSSAPSVPLFPKTVKSSMVSSATKDVQDWWKEQLRYDSGSEED
ncbi:sodium leak channel NALCN-like isoform X5 [Asterias amurensis]|uniref:sodium leak channel NALCN-like isoform X5 n=1 Tax=Asterias amurensis TaxID=7602 RepID=UPI003AB8C5F6